MSHVMRKPVYVICEQQRRRSVCTSAQSDQRLCCSLSGCYNTSTCYSQNFKNLASLCSWTGRFESYLVANSEDRFSRDVAHVYVITVDYQSLYNLCIWCKWIFIINKNTVIVHLHQQSKERAALCLGQLCVGEEKFPHRKTVIEGLLSSIQVCDVTFNCYMKD